MILVSESSQISDVPDPDLRMTRTQIPDVQISVPGPDPAPVPVPLISGLFINLRFSLEPRA